MLFVFVCMRRFIHEHDTRKRVLIPSFFNFFSFDQPALKHAIFFALCAFDDVIVFIFAGGHPTGQNAINIVGYACGCSKSIVGVGARELDG